MPYNYNEILRINSYDKNTIFQIFKAERQNVTFIDWEIDAQSIHIAFWAIHMVVIKKHFPH